MTARSSSTVSPYRATGVVVNGSANFTDGRMRSVQLDQIRLGRTQARGTIRIGDVVEVVLQRRHARSGAEADGEDERVPGSPRRFR